MIDQEIGNDNDTVDSQGMTSSSSKKERQRTPSRSIDSIGKVGRAPLVAVALLFVSLAVSIVIGIVARASSEAVLADVAAKAAIESVFVTTPHAGGDDGYIKLPADTQAYVDTPIYARTSGYLQHWYADIGTNVRKGALLAVVQTPELDQQVDQAAQEVETARANKQLAQITADRWNALLTKDAVSRQETDEADLALKVRITALNGAIANLGRLRRMQGFENIYAPFDGVVTERHVDIGSLIQAGDTNTQHGELFHLSSIDRLRLFVAVPEIYAYDVHSGQRVTVTSDALPNEAFTGNIVRNSTAISKTSRTLNVEIDVENANHHLFPGQYLFVQLPIQPGKRSVTLPANTLIFRSEGLRVGVAKDNHVHLVPVKIGNDYGATVEVTAGLSPTDKVILNPSDSLAEGAQITVEERTKE
jgi:RND family efflux transporter MFP subunit